jgi:mono/diheme cytochrome c family protein
MRRVLSFVAIVVLISVAGLILFSWYPALSPRLAESPSTTFDESLIARGAALSLIGNCGSCHTRDGGAAYGGGRKISTPFGAIAATNITPDPETGIGLWSEEAFVRAMHEGVRRDGAHLYPAFPYVHFTKMSVEDVRAVYAFLMTREPVKADLVENDLTFPFNFRFLIAGWKLLYFEPGEFRPDATQTPEWNRGAYLAEAVAHCSACHTPRNGLGAEQNDRPYSGGDVGGWHAPALNAASPAPVPWTAQQLIAYLRKGFVEPHGVAAGPMRSVVDSLGRVSAEDVEAIVTYVGSSLIPATAQRPSEAEQLAEHRRRSTTERMAGTAYEVSGRTIYAGACALCHEPTGQRFSARGIHLAHSKLLSMPDSRNLIHVIQEGIKAPEGTPAAAMPGFSDALTDEQLARLVGYLRASFTDRPAWVGVEGTVRKIRGARG